MAKAARRSPAMRVLVVTSQWPSPDTPSAGIFVAGQVASLRRLGVDVDVFSYRGAKRPLNYWRARAAVRRSLRRGGYDLAHICWGQNGLLALPTDLPLVVSLLGTDLFGAVGRTGRHGVLSLFLPRVSRFVARRADAVVVPTRRLRAELPASLAVAVIPFGIDDARFRPMAQTQAQRELGLDAGRQYVLFGADPSRPVKRFDLARATVDRLGDSDVTLLTLGGVPPTQVPLFLNACDALLITSSHEGGPIIAREVLACNVPVVSTDVGDVSEWVAGLEACRVCKDATPEALAEGLRVAMASRASFTGGREAVAPVFGDEPTRQLVALYRGVLAKKRSDR